LILTASIAVSQDGERRRRERLARYEEITKRFGFQDVNRFSSKAIDLRHIRVEEICVADVFFEKINIVDKRRWNCAV
jgi:hypothetical protein